MSSTGNPEMSETPKPLAGLKVVELGTLIAGPFCTRIMAEFGAEVIKVEAPDGGDPLRKWRKLYEGTSLWWYVQARNKKSVTANLKHPEGLRVRAQADRRGRHPGREFPSRRAGQARAGLGIAQGRQPRPGHGAPVRFRPDRPVQGSAGFRRGRRIDGRPALYHRLSGAAAGAHRHLDRRFDRRAVGGDRRADGACATRK